MKIKILVLIIFPFLLNGQIQKNEFIYLNAPFPSCHASTLEEIPGGLIAAWFGGKHEKNPDVGIWTSRFQNGKWSEPIEVANGIQNANLRYPTWNPVLFQWPNGDLLLFYKEGPAPDEWWGMMKRSKDNGKSWSEAEKLPKNIIGPVKNKPEMIGKTLLSPSSTEDKGWRLHMEFTEDQGKTWTRTAMLNARKDAAIQPSILKLKDGRLSLVCRSKTGFILQSFSNDNGKTWTKLSKTNLLNPNSGIDAVSLKDGRHLIVYNPTTEKTGNRGILAVAISEDGLTWKNIIELENEMGSEFSYPAIIQTSDGNIHITYTWKRQKIKHIILDINKI